MEMETEMAMEALTEMETEMAMEVAMEMGRVIAILPNTSEAYPPSNQSPTYVSYHHLASNVFSCTPSRLRPHPAYPSPHVAYLIYLTTFESWVWV